MFLKPSLFLCVSLFLPTCLALNMNMKGLLHCNATHPDPAKQTVTIELWEQDGGWFGFDKDDFLGRTVVHTSEPFEIWGSHRELDTMDIYLLIYHRCGRKEKEESAMLRVGLGRIPSLGNWNGGTATTDLGTIDLSWKWAEIEFWENSDFKKMLDEFAEVVAAHY